jgi:hypothetical protein
LDLNRQDFIFYILAFRSRTRLRAETHAFTKPACAKASAKASTAACRHGSRVTNHHFLGQENF